MKSFDLGIVYLIEANLFIVFIILIINVEEETASLPSPGRGK